MRSITVRSPAKINLFLEVICKRTDGYHEVKTYMVPISLCDTITLRRTAMRAISIISDNEAVPLGEDNLAYAAAVRFYKAAGIKGQGLEIRIKKQIPVAAGLGGGSSNAAATLRGLNRLYGNPVEKETLLRIAATLGADVPFFMHEGGAVCIGKGDEVIPHPCPKPFWVVLAVPRSNFLLKPGKTHKTARIYRALNLGLTKDIHTINILLYALECCDLDKIGRSLFNRLEEVALCKNTRLKRVRSAFVSHGASGALLSGSGPTVYAIAASRKAAAALRKKTARTFGSYFAFFIAKTLVGYEDVS